MTSGPLGLDRIAAARDREELLRLHAAALDVAYDEFRAALRIALTPEAEGRARADWREKRRLVHEAFGRRLRELEHTTKGEG